MADPLGTIQRLSPIECGDEAATHFLFDEGYINLNHGTQFIICLSNCNSDDLPGSYGTYPREIQSVLRHYQERTEARPDAFVRYEYRTKLLDDSRQALATYLDVPVDTCVLAPNSSTAFDTIIHNLIFKANDVVICFSSIYDSFFNTLQFKSETTPVEIEKIVYTSPISDVALCELFERKIKHLQSAGKNPRIAVFDTCNSLPGIRMPFERLTEICRANNVLSCIDGAHGVGQFPLDLATLNPDFFMSNLHKWLHVPRACGFLYAPARNQSLIRATLPTGFSFVPLSKAEDARRGFAANFASVGTLDDNPYLCIQAAIHWRSKLTWNGRNGEDAVMSYTQALALSGGRRVAEILQTETMDNDTGTLSACSMSNVRLPLSFLDVAKGEVTTAERIAAWIMKTMIIGMK